MPTGALKEEANLQRISMVQMQGNPTRRRDLRKVDVAKFRCQPQTLCGLCLAAISTLCDMPGIHHPAVMMQRDLHSDHSTAVMQ